MQHTTEDKLVPIGVIAKRLGISTRAVYRLVARGDFPKPVKVGGATRFYWSDLEHYLNRLREQRATN
ncbi:helix-turn-helix transcriptional regulator [Cerasicoccus frondis]|uniref:helix-turn-helix transcriptional regulator n=1 Tax=Cerasicoccus frondis TaxID=490090 RepID=UPI0028524CA7|nr:helix-turn-helix domain-containing protein [Cerasicoccus frondis]